MAHPLTGTHQTKEHIEKRASALRKGFWNRFVMQGECVVWTGGTIRPSKGMVYGCLGSEYVHRVVYEMILGHTIPKGVVVMHKCDVTLCARPSHLRGGTQAENARDCREKLRHMHGDSHYRAKLRAALIPGIRDRSSRGDSDGSIARSFGVCPETIRAVRIGRTWKEA